VNTCFLKRWLAVLGVAFFPALSIAAQVNQAAQAQTAQEPAPIRVRVNVVEVRVVVRDPNGKPVADLAREDFQVYDDGKPQTIANFTLETPEVRSAAAAVAASAEPTKELMPPGAPDRFVALVFDDTHLSPTDLMYARNSTTAFLDGLEPGDRVGLSSISGRLNHNFTADKEELKKALAGLSSQFAMVSRQGDCPKVSYFLANQVETFNDESAFRVIVTDALQCAYGGDARMMPQAESLARNAVRNAVALGQADNNQVYDQLMAIVKWMETKPGRRTVVFISPGVSLTSDQTRLQRVLEEANRQRIVINTMDARGMFTEDRYSATSGAPQAPRANTLHSQEVLDQMDLLINLADGTGGTHYLYSNDIAGGLKQLGDEPAITYILTFLPAAAKRDGAFHKLKVGLTGKRHYQIQARNGYYDEKKEGDSKQQVEAEIRRALYSGSESLDMPMELKLAAVQNGKEEAKIQIQVMLGIKDVPFRKEQDRNCNVLMTSVAIFDDDGNYMMGGEKNLELRLTAPTYEKFLNTGVPMRAEYTVQPGKYLVRQLVREGEGGRMSVREGMVEVPQWLQHP
jgi:VWFA-related protein